MIRDYEFFVVVPLLTGDLLPFGCLEITTFSNDTARYLSKYGLEPVPGKLSEMISTEAILVSDYPLFGPVWQGIDRKPHLNFNGSVFQPLIVDLMPYTYPEISTFSNNTAVNLRNYEDEGLVLGWRDCVFLIFRQQQIVNHVIHFDHRLVTRLHLPSLILSSW